MTAIMLFHVRSKYTAVGRKEIVLFFYIYMFVELLAIFLDSAIIPTSNKVYPVRRYAHGEGQLLTSVVHSGLRWRSWGSVLVHPYQRLCWISIPRRWDAHVALGERAFLSQRDQR